MAIIGIWGPDKSCKTTLGLTAPKPLVDMEFDIGGFDRAKHRFQQEINAGLITYEAYGMPIHIGQFDPAKLEVRPSKIIVGMKELFYRWLSQFVRHLNTPNIASIMVDTATLLYSIDCDAYLQEKQELQLPLKPDGMGADGKPLRTQLLQIEYREPNNRFRGILYNAKLMKKNLILIHHDRDEYGPVLQKDGTIAQQATGKRERAGFATLGDSADVILHTTWDTKTKAPYCTVDLAEVKELEGMSFKEPTYDKIAKTIQMLKGMC